MTQRMSVNYLFLLVVIIGMALLDNSGSVKAASVKLDIAASSLMEGQRQVYQSHLMNSLLFMDRGLNFGQQDDVYLATDIAFAPGSDESQMNFSWYAPSTLHAGQVQYAKVAAGTEVFPVKTAVTVNAQLKNAALGYSAHETTIIGLDSESHYMYRLGDGRGNWTESFHFQTQNPESYEFVMIADPQIGASGNIEADRRAWEKTLQQATVRTPDSSFIVSAGDQVDARDSEEEYAAYFAPQPLRNYPTATTIGNHDNTHHYSSHFNVPNENKELGNYDNSGGNYYFSYGDTLFMNLNSNSLKPEEHIQFMEETMEATAGREWKWKILIFHHSIYSAAVHSQSEFVLELREQLVPAIDAIGFDAVLMGHDHSYVRTYQMKNFQPLKNHMMQGETPINPEGTVYVTGSTASGSKFYQVQTERELYSAVREQWEAPTYMSFRVEPQRLSFQTYRTDTEELVDEYEIIKDSSIETIVPALEQVELTASSTVLATADNTFYPEVALTVSGENTEGGQYDILAESITFRTDSDKIQIKDGVVEAVENATVGTVEVYAEIVDGDQIWDSNVIELEVVDHDEFDLLAGGSDWRYLDDGSDQGTAWRFPEFDDGDWETGSAPLGFPEDEERPEFGEIETLIGYGSDEDAKIALTYFRAEFDVEQADDIGNRGYVEFGVDDGVILYLNGKEIMRFNMPETGEFGFEDYQGAVMDEYYGSESRIERIYLDETALSQLKDGRNVLSAQVHQGDRFSSDLYWDMELVVNTK